MSILKYVGHLFLGALLISLLFTYSFFQSLIVLLIFGAGVYFLIKYKLFWKTYAIIFAVFAIADTIGFTFIKYELYDYFVIPFTILTSVGLLAFAYKKVILNKLVWTILFFINVLFLILPYGNETSIFKDVSGLGLIGGTILLILYSYLVLPQYIGLFMYSFYSDDLWNESETKE